MESTSEFLTVKEASQLLNVKESLLRKLIFYKEIPYYKLGARLIRLRKEELMAWAEKK